DDGGDENGGTSLGEIILHLFPHIQRNGTGVGAFVFGQLNEQGTALLVRPHPSQDESHHYAHHQSDDIHGKGGQHGPFAEEHLAEQHIDGQLGAAGHKGGHQNGVQPVPGFFQSPGSHDGGNTAAES